MNERHLRTMIANRRPPAARPLFTPEVTGRMVRSASRAARARARAQEAWERIAPRAWLSAVRVGAVIGGVVTLVAKDAAYCERIRPQSARLAAALREWMPALRELRVIPREQAHG